MRIKYLDILKAIAILAVIVIHVAGESWYICLHEESFDLFKWQVLLVWLGLAKCGVPIFIMVSGALLLKKDYTVCDIVKRIMIIVGSIILMATVGEMTNIFLGNVQSDNPILDIASQVIHGTVPTYGWYLYTLIGFYLALPFFKAFVNGANEDQYRYTLILIFAFSSIIKFVQMFDADNSMGDLVEMLDMGIGYLSGFMGYFLMGYYMENHRIRVPEWMIYVGGIIGIGVSIVISLGNPARMEDYISYPMPGVVIYSVSMYMIYKKLAHRLSEMPVGKFLADLGSKTLGIYMFHMSLIKVLEYYGVMAKNYNVILSVPVMSLVILIVMYMIVSALKLIPGLRKLI